VLLQRLGWNLAGGNAD